MLEIVQSENRELEIQESQEEFEAEYTGPIGKSEFAKSRYGFYAPLPVGWNILVEIYVRGENSFAQKEDGTQSSILLPATDLKHDKWRSYIGLVIDLGSAAYKGERFRYSGPLCKIGDWITFRRNEGLKMNYRGIRMETMPDDCVDCIIEDPSFVVVE